MACCGKAQGVFERARMPEHVQNLLRRSRGPALAPGTGAKRSFRRHPRVMQPLMASFGPATGALPAGFTDVVTPSGNASGPSSVPHPAGAAMFQQHYAPMPILPPAPGGAAPVPTPTPYSLQFLASIFRGIAWELGNAYAALEQAFRMGAGAQVLSALEKQLADVLATRLAALLQATQAGPAYTYPSPNEAARWLSDVLRKHDHADAANIVDRVLYVASLVPHAPQGAPPVLGS